MSNPITQHLKRFSKWIAFLAVFSGLMAVLDCVFGHPIRKNLSLEGYALKASTGLAALLAGLALWLWQAPQESNRRRLAGRVCALGVAMVGFATLSAHLLAGQLHPGRLLLQEPVRVWSEFRMVRMSLFSAVAFSLLGSGLLLQTARSRRLQWASQGALLSSLVVSLLAAVQDIYGVHLFGWNSTIVLPGALLLLLLSVAAMCVQAERGLMADATSDGPGGKLIRHLLPAAVGVPFLIGWILETGVRHVWLRTDEGLAIFAVLVMGIFTILIWFIARSLNHLERERREALETRLRMAAIVDSSADAIIGKTIDGTITSWNGAAQHIYGYSAQEAIGQSILMIIPPKRRSEIAGLLNQVRVGRGSGLIETIRKTKDGRYIQVELTLSPILDPWGGILGVSSVGREITERKRLETELRQSHEQFQRMFQASPVSISLVTLAEGRILDANEAFCHITGYTRDEVLGRTALELGLWAEPERRAELMKLVEQQGGARGYEFRCRTKAGEIRQTIVAIEGIELETVPCLIFIVADITDRKQAETERECLIQELRQALANVKTLSGLLPICAGCKKIRDDRGYWNHVESYIQAHSGAKFSHGMCPDCIKKYYPDYESEINGQESAAIRPMAEVANTIRFIADE